MACRSLLQLSLKVSRGWTLPHDRSSSAKRRLVK